MVCKNELLFFILLPSTSTRGEELDKLIGGHIKKSIQINASEAKFLECSLLRHSSRRHLCLHIRLSKFDHSPHCNRKRKKDRKKRRKMERRKLPLLKAQGFETGVVAARVLSEVEEIRQILYKFLIHNVKSLTRYLISQKGPTGARLEIVIWINLIPKLLFLFKT